MPAWEDDLDRAMGWDEYLFDEALERIEEQNKGIWTMRDGTPVAIAKMTESHLRNTVAMIERNQKNGHYDKLSILSARFLQSKLAELKEELRRRGCTLEKDLEMMEALFGGEPETHTAVEKVYLIRRRKDGKWFAVDRNYEGWGPGTIWVKDPLMADLFDSVENASCEISSIDVECDIVPAEAKSEISFRGRKPATP